MADAAPRNLADGFVLRLIGAPRGRTVEQIADEVGLDHDTARHIAKSPLIKAFSRST